LQLSRLNENSCSLSKQFWIELLGMIGPLLFPTSASSSAPAASRSHGGGRQFGNIDGGNNNDEEDGVEAAAAAVAALDGNDNASGQRDTAMRSDQLHDMLSLAQAKGIWWRATRPV
jgi:hypothetical protein